MAECSWYCGRAVLVDAESWPRGRAGPGGRRWVADQGQLAEAEGLARSKGAVSLDDVLCRVGQVFVVQTGDAIINGAGISVVMVITGQASVHATPLKPL